MCLAICMTCACHAIIFISEESLFVDANKLSVVQTAVFHLHIIWYCDETTIALIASWKSVRYLNLDQGSQTQIAPWATWRLIRQPGGRIISLTQQCQYLNLLETAFSFYFLRKVSWIIGKWFLAVSAVLLISLALSCKCVLLSQSYSISLSSTSGEATCIWQNVWNKPRFNYANWMSITGAQKTTGSLKTNIIFKNKY